MAHKFSTTPMEVYKFLNQKKGRVPDTWDPTSYKFVDVLTDLVKKAKHFELPPRQIGFTEEEDKPGGWLANMSAECNKGIRLPYPVTSISREILDSDRLFFALFWDREAFLSTSLYKDYTDGFFVQVSFNTPKPAENPWVICPCIGFIKFADLMVGKVEEMQGTPIQLIWEDKKARALRGDTYRTATMMVVRDLIELSTSLNLKNTVEVVKGFTGVKAKIGAAKKLPKSFYEIHRVTIDPTTVLVTNKEHQGGTHASPRWHERRGYWRTMKKSGKRVWVRACEVGKKSNGMVYKDYEVVKTGE